jgi:tetratricopeptide (TPR) repeat protein
MKLKTALSLFTSAELKELGKLLDAEIFGNQAAIATCFHACTKLMRTGNAWTEADLSRALYPTKNPATNQQYLRTRTSALMRTLEAYLSWKTFQQDPVLQASCLVTALNQRGWESGYRHAYTAALDMIDQAPLRGFGHYAARVELVEGMLISQSLKPQLSSIPIFQEALDALESTYWSKKLSLVTKALVQDRTRQSTHRFLLIEDLDDIIGQPPLKDETQVQLAYCIYRMKSSVVDSSDIWYFRSRELFFDNKPPTNLRELAEAQDNFTHLVNHCVLRYNQKQVSFGAEVVQLFRRALESSIILENGTMEPHAFINAFLTFMYQGDREAMTWLISKYGNKISGNAALATRHYCLAYMKFGEGDYSLASDYLIKSLNSPPKTKHPQFEMDIHTLLARTYYMEGNYFDAEHQCHLILKYVRNISLEALRKQSYKTFSTYQIGLIKAAKSSNIKQQSLIQDLLRRIQETPHPFFASKWMQNELQKLKK